ncbi:MAG: DUF2723 domain-containing protein [Sandaracinaceae bacterium]
MSLYARDERNPNARLFALALAAGVPFAAYLATASAYDYWLDGGEFTAQAVFLDIAHPPGHPLAGLLGKLACLLPLGPIPLRVALAQAVCAAVAAGFLYRALDTTVRALGVLRDRAVVPLALGGTWLVSLSYAWWFQAVRPEVYALQAALVAIALERVVALEASWPTHDVRPLYVAFLALGLGLANHHLVAFLVLPALAPTLARVFRVRGARPLWICAGALAMGLLAYVYLPLRAGTDPPANLGDPTSPARLFWVVSARVYAHDMGTEAVQPLGERFLDVFLILGRNLANVWPATDDLGQVLRALFAVGLTLVAIYAALRTPGARRIGLVWTLVLTVSIGARAWLGSVRSNPDILGYLLPGIAAVGAMWIALVAVIIARIGQRPDGTPRTAATLVAICIACAGLAQLKASSAQASLASFRATDAFDEERVRRLPENAVVVAHQPQTVFRHWAVNATERARPDVTLVPMPFLGYPGVVEGLTAHDPEVAELLRGYLLHGELRQPDVQSLAARRPLLIEMDIGVPVELYETLVPEGMYYSVLDGGATDTDVLEAAIPHEATLDRLYRELGTEVFEIETANHLLWVHYMDALYYAAVGAREPARRAVQRGLAIEPETVELQRLGEALATGTDEDGPIDVTPFRVQSSWSER